MGVEAVVVASDVAVAGAASVTGAAAGTASVEAGREVADATEAAGTTGATGARLTHHTPAAATARTATAPPAIRGMRLVFRAVRARVGVIGVEIGDVPATASIGRDALACGWSDAGTGVVCAAKSVGAVAAAAGAVAGVGKGRTVRSGAGVTGDASGDVSTAGVSVLACCCVGRGGVGL